MASGSFAVVSSNKYVSCVLNWSSTPNTAGNYSDVYCELRASRTNSGYTTYGSGSGTINIGGVENHFSISTSQKITYNSNTLLGSGSARIYHEIDGTKSIIISVGASIPGASLTLGVTNETIKLDTIARCATITTAPNFTNTDNPVIEYSNPAGFKVNTWLEINPVGEHLCIREDIGDGGSYTYSLTDEERQSLIECCKKDTATVRFGMYTYNGSTLIGTHYVDKIFSLTEDIVPTAEVTILDAEGHYDKYGKYVQGQSKIQVSIAAEGVYGSTISTYKTLFDGQTFTDAEFTTGAIIGKDTLNLEVLVTDSRGRSCVINKEISVYEYKNPKILSLNAKRCQSHSVDEIGDDYIGVVFGSEVTSLDSQNSVAYEVLYKKISEESYSPITLSQYSNVYILDGYSIFAADDDAYDIILRITDDFGTVEKKTKGPSISVLVSKLKYNLGIAFGKLAELVGVLDIGFKTRFYGGILQMVLEEGADLNEQLTPNTFTLKEVGSAKYLNLPNEVTEGTGALTIVECGENVICHILRVFCNGKTMQYERYYYEDEWHDWASELDKKHPVGSIYMSMDETSPAELFGGTWEQIKDKFLLAAGDKYVSGSTGGSATHKHNDGSLVAAIGSSTGNAASLAFCAGSTAPLNNAGISPTYTVQGTQITNNGWSHATEVYGNTGESSSLPPYLSVYMWKRIA